MDSTTSKPSTLDEGPALRFRIGAWTVDPNTCRLKRGREIVKLEPKVMEVLVFLSARPGEVVSRDMLEASVWEGTIVGYDTVTGAIQKLRRAFGDDPRNPRVIETLSKRGYRLLEPVLPLSGPVPESIFSRSRRSSLLIAVALLSLVTILASVVPWPRTAPEDEAWIPASTSKSIAVLPFSNLIGDPDQEYLADGITDDLITQLAKLSDLVVIARDSSFAYKGQHLDVREVAGRLGVKHLLQGSVRRSGERLRVNAQLIDAVQGTHLWAESYDGTLVDFFDVQDRITRRIVSALAARMNAWEREELGRPATIDPDAYDSFLQGRQRFLRYANKEENLKARELFVRAVAADPDFAMAYAMLAWTHAFDAMNGWSDHREQSLRRARELAETALSIEESLPLAYFVTGLSYRETGEYVKALVEAEKAITFDPNYANAHVLLATLLYYAGRPEEGLQRIKKAMRLNPHHPYNYSFHLGQAYYILHRYTEAIEAFKLGLASNPASERLQVWLAAAYAQAGLTDEAAWQADQVLVLNPEFSVARMRETFPFKDLADRTHFEAGLYGAGLPR